MSVANHFDASTRRLMADLYGEPGKTIPTREEYRQQLRKWFELTDKHLTQAELEAVIADQDRRIAVKKIRDTRDA